MRCAVYTRKSVDEGLDREFTTLDNQRAFCASYIDSQGGQGWTMLSDHYDDGGYSGGSLRRPALTQLRADIEAGKIDVVVVYKIDRLSRSLRDFANLVAEFETRGVTFVSVTQSFDSGTAMGRLTLNVLLSFAQFERELTSERLRDWFAGARAQGLWTRQRPYGYVKDGDSNRLVVDPGEAKVLRWIYRRYIAIKSAEQVADELYARGIRNTLGRPWTGSMVRHAIAHPVYLGKMVHRRKPVPGKHAPIVSAGLWRRANALLNDARNHRMGGLGSKPIALLAGLLYDRTGQRIVHTFAWARDKLYRYYIAQQERRAGYGKGSDPYMRFRAPMLEDAVIAAVERMTGNIIAAIPSAPMRREKLRIHVDRIDIEPAEAILHFRTGAKVRVAIEDCSLGKKLTLNRGRMHRPRLMTLIDSGRR